MRTPAVGEGLFDPGQRCLYREAAAFRKAGRQQDRNAVAISAFVLLSWTKQWLARAQVFHDRVVEHTEAGAAAAGDAIVTFDGVAVLHPRGRFEIEMYATFLKLLGQARHRCS